MVECYVYVWDKYADPENKEERGKKRKSPHSPKAPGGSQRVILGDGLLFMSSLGPLCPPALGFQLLSRHRDGNYTLLCSGMNELDPE